MTLQELITDLKAAGANENTVRLAMNCYQIGRMEVVYAHTSEVVQTAIAMEREACAQLAKGGKIDFAPPNIHAVTAYNTALDRYAESIRARGQQ